MPTLNVHVDEDLLQRAERLASARQMTVEEMVERLLRVMAQPAPASDQLPPATRTALGILPPMTDDEVARVLDEERTHKFGER